MKTDKETLKLRDGALTITIEAFSLADFETLSDESKWALVQASVDAWKYRGACRQTKEEGFVNDGKAFSLASIASDFLREGNRSSGPSKADRERGEDLADRARKACPIEESDDAEAARASALAARRSFVEGKFAAAQSDKPWISWQWDDDKDLLSNCIAVQHAVRQPKPEPKKKVSKYL